MLLANEGAEHTHATGLLRARSASAVSPLFEFTLRKNRLVPAVAACVVVDERHRRVRIPSRGVPLHGARSVRGGGRGTVHHRHRLLQRRQHHKVLGRVEHRRNVRSQSDVSGQHQPAGCASLRSSRTCWARRHQPRELFEFVREARAAFLGKGRDFFTSQCYCRDFPLVAAFAPNGNVTGSGTRHTVVMGRGLSAVSSSMSLPLREGPGEGKILSFETQTSSKHKL